MFPWVHSDIPREQTLERGYVRMFPRNENPGPACLQKCVGDFVCCISFGGFCRGFLEDFSGHFFRGQKKFKPPKKKNKFLGTEVPRNFSDQCSLDFAYFLCLFSGRRAKSSQSSWELFFLILGGFSPSGFSHKNEEEKNPARRSAQKSGGPKIEMREKIRSAKNRP